jgi:glutathione S-transferase
MLQLHQFAPAFGAPNPSPFCMKLECFLRMTGIPYETVLLEDPRKTPKGKGPFVVDDGQRIGDSALIIEHLKRTRGVDPDAHLSQEERAVGRAIGLMLEEHLYFAVVYSRWADDANWPLIRGAFFGSIPALLRPVVAGMIRRKVRGMLVQQGIGRHSPAEIDALGIADIDALAAYLGDKPHVMGEQPSLVDCIAHALVCILVRGPFTGALVERARSHANLVAYDQRMMTRFFAGHAPEVGVAA